jgi:hypothetical protein
MPTEMVEIAVQVVRAATPGAGWAGISRRLSMKKILVLTATAAMALSLTACGGHGADNTTVIENTTVTEDSSNLTFGNDAIGNDALIDTNATDANTAEGNAL